MLAVASRVLDYPDVSARHFELLKRPELIVPEAALRRRSINYSGSKPPVLTYRDNKIVSSTNGTHTHSGLSFGPADPNRALIVVATYSSPIAVSIAVGGVPATACKQQIFSNFYADIWIASVPTGTSGSVVLSGPPGSQNWSSSVGVYSVVGLLSLTPTDTDGATANPATSVSTSVDVQSSGVAVSVALGGTAATGATWIGASGDFYNENTIEAIASGSFTATPALTLAVTTAFDGAAGLKQAATASFR